MKNMSITKIDKNFDTSFECPKDVKWHSILDNRFSIYGVSYSEEEKIFRRFPKTFAGTISESVEALAKHTSGGRVRFKTNSSYIVLYVEEPFEEPFPHMAISGKNGVSIYINGKFTNIIAPSYHQITNADPNFGGNGKIVFDGIVHPSELDGREYQVEIYLPLYSGVRNIFIGLDGSSSILPPKPYKHEKPVIFYGSSITQGGCASKPGDDYPGRLSRMIDVNYVNYGLSGNAKAEPEMADFIAKQSASIFVLDYDHNAPDSEYLKTTHFALYKTVRDINPETPIIIMTMPAFDENKQKPINKARRDVIFKTLEKAKKLGDKNIYLIDCYGCFGSLSNGECGTVDGCHPDSLGFLRMSEKIYPVLNCLLNDISKSRKRNI